MLTSRLVFPPFANPTFIPSMLIELQGYMYERGVFSLPLVDMNIELFNQLFASSHDVPILKDSNIYQDYEQYIVVVSRVINEWQKIQNKFVKEARDYVFDKTNLWEDLMQVQLDKLLPLPQVIGLSLTYHQRNDVSQFWMTLALATWIKHKSPETIVVIGGSLVNHLDPKEILSICPAIDLILLKESEESWVQVIEGKQWSQIENAVYRNKEEIIETSFNDNVCRDLSYLPKADGLSFSSYLTPVPVISLLIKRGCPWSKCNFCSGHLSYFGHHPNKNWDSLKNRLIWLRQHQINYIYWSDQMIMIPEAKQIAKLVKEYHPQLKWAFMAMPNVGFTLELLTELANCGCSWITWGVESGSVNVLKAMNKPIKPEIARANVIAAYTAGIVNIVLMMYGFPGEKPEDLEESLSFLKSITPYYYDHAFGGYYVTIDSPVFNDPVKFGVDLLGTIPLDEDNLYGIRSHLISFSPSYQISTIIPSGKCERAIPVMEGMMIALEFFKPKAL